MPTQHNCQHLSDSDLLQHLLTLDKAAWGEFHRRYDRMIWACMHRVLTRFSGIVASDALQEIRATFYASLLANDLNKLRRFEVERGNRFGTWLGMLAINATWDHLRTSQRRPTDALATCDNLQDQHDLFEYQCTRQECDRLADAVRALPIRDQDFVRLMFVESYSPQEVADALHMNIKSVYTRKHRLTRHLRGLLTASSDCVAA
jgi:RNA polymerase sigma-70 factor, ECF subfamily